MGLDRRTELPGLMKPLASGVPGDGDIAGTLEIIIYIDDKNLYIIIIVISTSSTPKNKQLKCWKMF